MDKMTIKEVAELLGVCKDSVRHYIQRGILHVVSPEGLKPIKVSKQEVEEVFKVEAKVNE